MTTWHYINGAFVQEDEARIPIKDLGLIRGYGVFDFVRIYNKAPFHLEDHLVRLEKAATTLALSLPPNFNELKAIVGDLIEKNKIIDGGMRLVITGGESADQLMPSGPSSLIIMAFHSKFVLPSAARAVTIKMNRFLPSIKTTHYTPAILAMKAAKAAGVDEALYLNDRHEILEATRSNFFAFKQGVLITDDSDEIVHGVTRKVLLELAKDLFPIELRPLHTDELSLCDEAFICSSGKEVLPLIEIDGQKIGNGQMGERTQLLSQRFKEYLSDYLKTNHLVSLTEGL